MGKKFLLLIPVIVIIAIAGFIWFTLNPAVAAAQLVIDSGTAEVMHQGGNWQAAQDGMLLSQSDSVRTGDNSAASIILFQSSIIRLDSNTIVRLQEIILAAGETTVKVKQDVGRTWNTVLKISGIDNYEVQTPTTVASVRGISFGVDVNESGETGVGVGRGTVGVSSYREDDGLMHIHDTIDILMNQMVNIDPDTMDQELQTVILEIDDWVTQNQQKDEAFIDQIKRDFYERIGSFLPLVKEQYGLNDEELDEMIDGYLRGYYDLPPDTPEWAREIIELT